MSKAQLIAERFDLQKRGKLCNVHDCGRFPVKRVSLVNENRITRQKKPLVTLFLCSSHYETRMPAFMTDINTEREVGWIVTKKVSETGLVTY